MANDKGISLLICGTVCFVISSLAYVIAIGVGWALDQDIYPDNGLIRAGIIIVTAPVIAAFFYCLAYGFCGNDSEFTLCAECCAICTVCLAGLFELIGGIMLIAAGTKLKSDSSKAMVFGIVAGFFSIIAAVFCCCSVITVCGSAGMDEDTHKKLDEED